MNPRLARVFSLLLAVAAAVMSGCSSSPPRDVKEVIQMPVREIGKGVQNIDAASGNIVGKLLTDRNRASLVREHRDTREHLNNVKKFIKERKIVTEKADDKLIQDAEDRLASVGRQLDAERIPSAVGLRMYRQLEDVRQSLHLLRQRHNTPRYMGYIADR